jgi:hypothetical protein
MNRRARTTRALAVATMAAVGALGALTLAGCDLPGASGKPAGAAPAASAAPSAPAPDTSASTGPSKPAGAGPSTSAPARKGGLPDPCGLLSRAEVSALTGGKQITQVDHDKPTDETRFCQWQLSGARLAVFLTGTTKERFAQQKTAQTRPVPGLGDDAFTLAGHLFVRHGNLQVDVYASNGNDTGAQNLQLEKAAVEKILPRL